MLAVDFECSKCSTVFERIVDAGIKDRKCPECGNLAKRIITSNTGHRADPTWLESACEVLQADDEKPIESRTEFDKYLKDNNIEPRC